MTDSDARRVVLVLEDEPQIVAVLTRVLEQHGFRPVSAGTVAAAIEAVESSHIAAVILDLRLSSESGLQFLAWFRRHRPYVATPVLIHTGVLDVDEEQQEQIRRLGAYVFYKPESYTVLIEHLQDLLR